MQEELTLPEKQPLFELCTERLAHWLPKEDTTPEMTAASNCKYLEIITKLTTFVTFGIILFRYLYRK